MRPLTLIRTRIHPQPAYDVLHDFERAAAARPGWSTVNGPASRWGIKARSATMLPLHALLRRLPSERRLVSFSFGLGRWRFGVRGGLAVQKALPHLLLRSRLKALWMCDAWEPDLDVIQQLAERFEIDVVMTSSRQAAQLLGAGPRACGAAWVPEGIDPAQFRFAPFADKDIDVVQIGRQWDWYNHAVDDRCARLGIRYLHSGRDRSGPALFAGREAFVSALARARISICVPRIVTHPEETGCISTLTNRFLQSMASKCLVLGVCPDELRSLFGYDPVVPVDPRDPAGQLRDILDRFDDYVALIERNHAEVTRRHHWDDRVARIEATIAAHERGAA